MLDCIQRHELWSLLTWNLSFFPLPLPRLFSIFLLPRLHFTFTATLRFALLTFFLFFNLYFVPFKPSICRRPFSTPGVFLICWLPFFVTHILNTHCKTCYVPPALYGAFTWLGYVNSALNPIIYTTFNIEFRRAFIKILSCWGMGARQEIKMEMRLRTRAARCIQSTVTADCFRSRKENTTLCRTGLIRQQQSEAWIWTVSCNKCKTKRGIFQQQQRPLFLNRAGT